MGRKPLQKYKNRRLRRLSGCLIVDAKILKTTRNLHWPKIRSNMWQPNCLKTVTILYDCVGLATPRLR